MRRLIALGTLNLVATGVVAVAVGTGCPAREVSKIDPAQQPEEVKVIPVSVNRDVDILFVIDNSGSMGEEQTSLTANFFRFIQVLENIEGGLPNVHIGIVSSNTGVGGFQITGCGGEGDDGRLLNQARTACTPPSGYYISDIQNMDGTRQKNYSGTLADTFSCIAKLGTDGCGFEQHLESMKRALDGSNPQNQGFLRDDAFLAVIIIADEDDCSAKDSTVFDPSQTDITSALGPLSSFRCTEFGIACDGAPITRSPASYGTCVPRADSPYIKDPQDYVAFLKGLKPEGMVLVAGIIGNPTPVAVSNDMNGKPQLEPSCVTGAGEAAPGVRFENFLTSFPDRNTFTSICNEDLSDALTTVAQLLARVVGNPCLDGDIDKTDLDANPDNGLQIDCSIADVKNRNTSSQEATPIRRCDMANATTPVSIADGQAVPCWYVVEDLVQCMNTPSNLILTLMRASDPPQGTTVVARCTANQH